MKLTMNGKYGRGYLIVVLILSLLLTSLLTGELIKPVSANGSNEYEYTLSPHPCTGSGVKFIDSNNDWNDINNPNYRIFCVEPGDYSGAGTITITASGQENYRKWIRWYDPQHPDDNGTHTYDMAGSDRAKMARIVFDGANYWTVDRIQFTKGAVELRDGAHHNVLNRILMWEADTSISRHGVMFDDGAHHNWLQNSVIANTQPTPGMDSIAVVVRNAQHNIITKNEIFNIPGDTIQIGPDGTDNKGTIIVNNDLYINPNVFTDGNGNYTTNGDYACAENAIDIKSHSPNPGSSYLLIENNRMWGFRETDSSCGGTGSGGSHIVLHYGSTDQVRIRKNNFWNGLTGIYISKNDSMVNFDIKHNVFQGLTLSAMKLQQLSSSQIHHNTMVNVSSWMIMNQSNQTPVATNNSIYNNVLIDSGLNYPNANYHSSNSIEANAYYNSTKYNFTGTGDGSIIRSSASASGNQDYTFGIKRITSPSSTKTIPYGEATSGSPHAAWFGL